MANEFFWSVSISIATLSTSTRQIGDNSANRAFIMPFILPSARTISKMVFIPAAPLIAGMSGEIGLYDSSGAIVVRSGLLSAASLTAGVPNTISLLSSVNLAAGLYYHADCSGASPFIINGVTFDSTSASIYNAALPLAGILPIGQDATPTVGGLLNATVTAVVGAVTAVYPFVLWAA